MVLSNFTCHASITKFQTGSETADAFIAAVDLANGFAVATRDTTPFEAAGVNVINPWEAR